MRTVLLFTAITVCSGCGPEQIPKEALLFSEESPARRKLQTRRFETKDEQALLGAGAAVLKELGLTIDQRSPELGLIAASKRESAYNFGEMAASAATAVIAQALNFSTSLPFSKEQLIRASLVSRPETGGGTTLRVAFQRVVWDTEGRVTRSELLEDPALYRDFFDKLSKATGLEAHEL